MCIARCRATYALIPNASDAVPKAKGLDGQLVATSAHTLQSLSVVFSWPIISRFTGACAATFTDDRQLNTSGTMGPRAQETLRPATSASQKLHPLLGLILYAKEGWQ